MSIESDTTFSPDYALWWNKKDLSEDELATLVFGIDPQKYEEAEALCRQAAPDDKSTIKQYERFLEESPYLNRHNLRENIARLKAQNYWTGDKQEYIRKIYVEGISSRVTLGVDYLQDVHPTFWDYLEKIGEKPSDYDQYREHSCFQYEYDGFKEKDIISQHLAVSLILGLHPDSLNRYIQVSLKDELTEDDRAFIRQYFLFETLQSPFHVRADYESPIQI